MSSTAIFKCCKALRNFTINSLWIGGLLHCLYGCQNQSRKVSVNPSVTVYKLWDSATRLYDLDTAGAQHILSLMRYEAIRIHDTTGLACYYQMQAYLSGCQSGNFEEAIQYADSGMHLASGGSTPLRFRAYFGKGLAYLTDTRHTDSAIGYFLQAEDLAINDSAIIREKSLMSQVYTNIAILHNLQHNMQEASKYFRRALDLAWQQKDTPAILAACYGLAMNSDAKDTVEVGYYAHLHRDIATHINDSTALAYSWSALGKYFLASSKSDSAIRYFRRSAMLTDRLKLNDRLSSDYEDLALLYLDRGDIDSGQYWLNRSGRVFTDNPEDSLWSDKFLRGRAKLKFLTGDKDSAFTLLARATQIHEEQEKYLNDNRLLAHERTIERIRHIEQLREREAQVDFAHKISGISIGSSIILCICVAGFVFQWKRKRILASDRQNLLLSQRAYYNQLKPHFAMNALSPLQRMILRHDETAALEYLSDFAQILHQMLSQPAGGFDKLSAKIDFLNRYLSLCSQYGNANFSYKIIIDEQLVPEQTWIPVLIVQPIVENAVRHGFTDVKNGLITITFSLNKNRVIATVEDNGKGMDEEKFFKSSHSLDVIIQRLRLIEKKYGIGKITFDSKRKGRIGTLVTIQFPFFTLKPES